MEQCHCHSLGGARQCSILKYTKSIITVMKSNKTYCRYADLNSIYTIIEIKVIYWLCWLFTTIVEVPWWTVEFARWQQLLTYIVFNNSLITAKCTHGFWTRQLIWQLLYSIHHNPRLMASSSCHSAVGLVPWRQSEMTPSHKGSVTLPTDWLLATAHRGVVHYVPVQRK
jgi:hypothetical protein